MKTKHDISKVDYGVDFIVEIRLQIMVNNTTFTFKKRAISIIVRPMEGSLFRRMCYQWYFQNYVNKMAARWCKFNVTQQ